MAGAAAASGPHVLREMNGAAVLMSLRASGTDALRVSDLVGVTGLSRPAVTRALTDLSHAGLVEELDAEDDAARQMGRPARLYRFRAEAGYVCGVDIGPHKVLVIVSDLAGRAVASRRKVVPPGTQGAELIKLARGAIAETLRAGGLITSDLWAVCVGTPGIVDRERGVVLQAPSIPGWAGLSIVPELEDWIGCPVYVDNDVTLAVLAECTAGEVGDNLVLVHWGERIGAGIVVDGRPYRGAANAAGELGFIDIGLAAPGEDIGLAAPGEPFAEQGSVVSDGMGPFERLVGAEAILRLALAAYAQARTEPPVGLTEHDGLGRLFEAAEGGDPTALAVVDQVAARFAHGLGILLLLQDPGCVVIGGGLSVAGETLLAPVRRHLARHVLSTATVVASELGEQGVALGAVRFALEAIEARLTARLGLRPEAAGG